MTTTNLPPNIREMATHFIPINDPLARFGNTLAHWQFTPGLRGIWTGGSIGDTGTMVDQSGQARNLTNNGTALYLYEKWYPFFRVDGSTQFFNRTDEAGLSITGTEAFVGAAQRGLSIVYWIRLIALSGGTQRGVAGKWLTTGNQRSYLAALTTGNVFNFTVSNDGTATTTVAHTIALATGQWYFVANRFDPSTELSVTMNDPADQNNLSEAINTTSIPASIFDSTAAFEIGRFNASSATCVNADYTLVSLHTEWLSDAQIFGMYEQSRVLFGV